MQPTWLDALRRYLAATLILNLVWEAAQMPLYTLWQTGSLRQIVLYGLHCTVGDLLIALSALMLALFVLGSSDWPKERFLRVAVVTTVLGAAYTIGSEWINVHVQGDWAYADAMPVVFGIGLTPILQWLAIPPLAFWWAGRQRGRYRS